MISGVVVSLRARVGRAPWDGCPPYLFDCVPSHRRAVVPLQSSVMRICCGNLKGGVGKTTSSVYLALGLACEGRTLLVDADPEQASAFRWSELAGDDWPTACVVVPLATRRLYERVEQLVGDYEHLVVDVGPKNPLMLRQAMALAQHLVVPVAPRPLDLAELPGTFELAAEVDATSPLLASVLLVQVRAGTRSASEARELLTGDLELPVLTAETHLRESYSLAYGSVPDSLGEYADVLAELQKGES